MPAIVWHMSNRWKRDGETAIVEKVNESYWAWNVTRTHLAVMPADKDRRVSFDTLEELEAALRADGWEPA